MPQGCNVRADDVGAVTPGQVCPVYQDLRPVQSNFVIAGVAGARVCVCVLSTLFLPCYCTKLYGRTPIPFESKQPDGTPAMCVRGTHARRKNSVR